MRAFLATFATCRKTTLLQSDRYCHLLLDVLLHYQKQDQFALHAFVVMPDHVHVVLSPRNAGTVEKCVQFIKGSFSYRMKKEFGYAGEIWQPSFHDRRLRDERELAGAVAYTHNNPVRRGLCARPEEFVFSSAHASRATSVVLV